MSKNFELLERAGRAEEMLQVGNVPLSRPRGVQASFDAKSLEREEIHNLVQRVFALEGNEGPQVVVFSGVGKGSGSPRICALAAQSLAARATGTVCAVDADFRMPALHTYFDEENLGGLADGVLSSGPIREKAVRIAFGNLWLIPAGPTHRSASPLIMMDRLKSRLQELRQEFDHVLINAPEADRYTDSAILGRGADGMILVIEANSTPRASIEKAKASLSSAGIRLLGAVLNNRTFPIPQAIYRRLR
jgi:protein-tyrosine kinase